MPEEPLLQIVTGAPGTGDGVADYAAGIAREWDREGRGNGWLILGPNPGVDGDRRTASFVRHALERSRSTQVLLHLSGYGYDRNGAPAWLVDGLAAWRHSAPGRRLVVFFHELFAVAPPWRSAFWHAPAQKAVVKGLLAVADGGLTSNDAYHAILRRWRPARFKLAPPLPIPSNIAPVTEGDAEATTDRTSEPSAIIFGQPATRARVYRRLAGDASLRAVLARLALHDVGRPLPPMMDDGLQITAHGLLPNQAVARLLANCGFGLIHYKGQELAKSSVFAAYARFGLTVINLHRRVRAADGLAPGHDYLTAEHIRAGLPDPAVTTTLSNRLSAWSERTGPAHHARILIGLLGDGRRTSDDRSGPAPRPPGYRQNVSDAAVARLETPVTRS